MRICFILAAFASIVCASVPLQAQQQVKVTIENLQPDNGFFLTPVWVGFHNGGFDYMNAGTLASNAVEQLAEDGDVDPIRADFAAFGNGGQDGVIGGPAGVGGVPGQPPLVDTGEITSLVFGINPSNRYLSYGTMLIPSNDAFFGNDDPMAIEIFDANGAFVPVSRTFTLSDLLDAGTEQNLADGSVNDGFGAAFSAVNGGAGLGTPESNAIAIHSGLASVNGLVTAAGATIDFGAASNTSDVFRVTVSAVPEPGSFLLLGVFGTMTLLRRRR